jgi:hypothetical protein
MRGRTLLILVLWTFMAFTVRGQATLTASVYAELTEMLKADETDQLNFGRFTSEEEGGQVIVTPDGVRTAQGNVYLVHGGIHSPGRFKIVGIPNADITIKLPDEVLLSNQSSGQYMLVHDWITVPPANQSATINENGSLEISLGATLTVGPIDKNPVGAYAGSFSLTFAYN